MNAASSSKKPDRITPIGLFFAGAETFTRCVGTRFRGYDGNRLPDVHRVRAHLDRQRDLADHVARVRADDATAEDLAVAMRLSNSYSHLGIVIR